MESQLRYYQIISNTAISLAWIILKTETFTSYLGSCRYTNKLPHYILTLNIIRNAYSTIRKYKHIVINI